MLDQIIIGMVLNTPLTGYDIKKKVETGLGIFYRASYGSLYPALKKLTRNGLLTMSARMQGNRMKKYYQASESGTETFFTWLSSRPDPSSPPDTHLAKVYFFDRLPEDIRNRQLLDYETRQLWQLQDLQARERHFNTAANQEQYYFMLSTLYYGIQTLQNRIKWCRHIRERKPLTALIKEEN